jgi:hypothetical protein
MVHKQNVPRRSTWLLTVLALVLGAGWAFSQAVPAPLPVQTAGKSKSPVVVGGKTLFYVEERVYSFSPADRARAIAERIQKIYKERQFSLNSIHVEDEETTTDVVANDTIIMAVTDRDAHAAGRGRKELAQEYARIIRAAVAELQNEHSAITMAIGLLWTVLATGILLLALMLLKKVFPRVNQKLDVWRGTRIRSLRIQKLELLTAERITDTLLMLVRGGRMSMVLILLYFYVSLVFSFFPGTRGWAGMLFGYVMSPVKLIWEAIANNLPDFFFVAVILIVAYYGIKLVKFIFAEIGKGTIEIPGFYRDWAEPTFKIVRFLLIAFTAVVVFPRSTLFPGLDFSSGEHCCGYASHLYAGISGWRPGEDR